MSGDAPVAVRCRWCRDTGVVALSYSTVPCTDCPPPVSDPGRIICEKPSGPASQVLSDKSAGISPPYVSHYVRHSTGVGHNPCKDVRVLPSGPAQRARFPSGPVTLTRELCAKLATLHRLRRTGVLTLDEYRKALRDTMNEATP